MKRAVIAYLAGFLFALGLGISGMTQPGKIVGFLDFFGSWDPSLAFVMAGALGVHFSAYRFAKRLPAPIFSSEWFLPTDRNLPPSLFVGAALFGVGWALGGYCPGPALVSLASGNRQIFLFVGAMILGMLPFRFLRNRRNAS